MSETSDHPDRRFADFEHVLDWIWDALERGVASSRHAYHTPVVATCDPDDQPDARVVVLRRVDRDRRALMFHSDARSPKVQQLRHRPTASWVFWSPPEKVQLRAVGVCSVHLDDELADRQWDASTAASRRCYLAPHPPSETADAPAANLPEDVRDAVPSADRVEAGRGNFAVVRTELRRLDWLYLHHTGHRRARFQWDSRGAIIRERLPAHQVQHLTRPFHRSKYLLVGHLYWLDNEQRYHFSCQFTAT